MKKIILPILMLICCINMFAQLTCELPMSKVEIDEEIPLDFIPELFTDDVWASPTILGDRRVFFVHGLGGQGDEDGTVGISWSQASLWSQTEYKINASRPDYADVSLSIAAAELKDDLEGIPGSGSNAIFIGHSQGGIVGRRIDYSYYTGEWGPEPRSFGGLVTFGSSHQGARVLNNKEDLTAWSGTTCEALTKGYINETIESNFYLDLLLNATTIDGFQDFFCDAIENNIAPFIFKDYYSGITESYEVGSEQLQELNEFTPEIPYVCFYGVETEPVMWNTLVHTIDGHEPNNVVTYGEEPFGCGNDESLKNWADMMTDQYYLKYSAYGALADMYEDLIYGFDFPTIPCYIIFLCAINATNSYEEVSQLSEDFKLGYDWFVDANATWKGFIGALEFTETDLICTCIDDGPLGDLEEVTYIASPDGECITEDYDTDCYLTQYYGYITKESDGVVLKESASECLGQVLLPDYKRRMEESNHFSMRNDFNTELKLTSLFEGGCGLYFYTALR
ncbi:MAG: esterase/lipase family protein [Chitinophagales bacterium]